MTRATAERLLLVLILPVWAVGLFHSWQRIPDGPGSGHPKPWFIRYARLAPALQGVPVAGFAYDPNGLPRGHKSYFRAQYVLAPTILQPIPELEWAEQQNLPIILDFESDDGLDEALAAARSEATRRGIRPRIQRFPGSLALVRLGDG